MNIFILVLMFSSGFLASVYFLKNVSHTERLGSSIFFAIAAVSLININLALFSGVYLNLSVVFMPAVFTLLLFLSLNILKNKQNANLKSLFHFSILKDEWLTLGALSIILVFLFFYYSNNEFLLSLASYFTKETASCFYMQTFRIIGLLNPGVRSLDSLVKVYDIICTPGNVLFTATPFLIFKMSSFKILYLIFNALLFIFTYFICKRLLKNKIAALVVAIFSILNPYILSVEVLDRNVMALSISAIFFYCLFEHKEKIFLQGFIFGLLAGTGLRFLPLLFIIPMLILWGKDASFRRIMLFVVAFLAAFLFNIPHFFFNGLNSLGEGGAFFELLILAFTKWMRTPFLPFPNILFYLINLINYFGYLVSGFICFGAYFLLKENKRLFFAFLSMFLLVLIVLSFQRNWIEGDKYRIIICAFLPVYIFLGFGIKAIFNRINFKKMILAILISLSLPIIFVNLCSKLNFPQDLEFYKRRLIYQQESRDYYQLLKKSLSNVGVFPNYQRLFTKLKLGRKVKEERSTFSNLFSKADLPGSDNFNTFYKQWGNYFIKNSNGVKAELTTDPNDFVYLKINFDKLVLDMHNAVTEVPDVEMVSLDLSNPEQLSDTFYAQIKVSWQNNDLPVCLMLNNDNLDVFKELVINLNAFISVGKDDLGLDIVNAVNFVLNPGLRKYGYNSGMKSFPLYEEDSSFTFKVPKNAKIIIKNWFVNGQNGIPFKVDSWGIKRSFNGRYVIKFYYNEPESYL